MSDYIQHRLFIRAESFEAASRIIARYAGHDKAFTFTKVLPNPNGDENDEIWNIANWGTYWDCSHSLILRPVGTPVPNLRIHSERNRTQAEGRSGRRARRMGGSLLMRRRGSLGLRRPEGRRL